MNLITCSNFVVNQAHWNIKEEDYDPKDKTMAKAKDVTLKIMNNAWKQFKSTLKTEYMEQGRNPVGVYPWLTQETWE